MPNPSPTPSRAAASASDRIPAEVACALSSGGEARATSEEAPAPATDAGLEHVIAARVSALLARLGDVVPALHEAVMGQAERGLFKAVLDHTANHLGRASKILGLDRNTCARKARSFGLVDQPSRGRKPAKKPRAKAAQRPTKAAKRGK